LLRRRVRAVRGVSSASVNVLTGSVIIHYDGCTESRAEIFAHLGLSYPASPCDRVIATDPVRPDLADLVTNVIAEWLTERLVKFAIAAWI
jgi:hypothetical protein